MKNFAITTLAVVTLTMLASNAAQAQSGYTGSPAGYGNSLQLAPYPTQLPAHVPSRPVPSFGNGYTNTNPACVGGRCPTGSAGAYPSTGYRSDYPNTSAYNQYQGQSGFGLGSTIGSWFGLRPQANSNCQNGQCPPPAYRPTTSYRPAPYTPGRYSAPQYNTMKYNTMNLNSGSLNRGSGAFYGSY